MLRFSILLVSGMLTFGTMGAAQAADASAGAGVFGKNCNSCHSGGKNIMNPAKTLSLADLKANSHDSEASIAALVSDGKPPMPAFGKMLSADDIANVAAYVLQQANAGWK